jgi:hypothetical protein
MKTTWSDLCTENSNSGCDRQEIHRGAPISLVALAVLPRDDRLVGGGHNRPRIGSSRELPYRDDPRADRDVQNAATVPFREDQWGGHRKGANGCDPTDVHGSQDCENEEWSSRRRPKSSHGP